VKPFGKISWAKASYFVISPLKATLCSSSIRLLSSPVNEARSPSMQRNHLNWGRKTRDRVERCYESYRPYLYLPRRYSLMH